MLPRQPTSSSSLWAPPGRSGEMHRFETLHILHISVAKSTVCEHGGMNDCSVPNPLLGRTFSCSAHKFAWTLLDFHQMSIRLSVSQETWWTGCLSLKRKHNLCSYLSSRPIKPSLLLTFLCIWRREAEALQRDGGVY